MSYFFFAVAAVALWKVGEILYRNTKGAYKRYLEATIYRETYPQIKVLDTQVWVLGERVDKLEKMMAEARK